MKKGILTTMVIGFCAVFTNAEVVVSHSGTTDPTTEGWALYSNGSPTVWGKANDDGGVEPPLSVPCWDITTSGAYAYYEADISTADLSNGWQFSMQTRSLTESSPYGAFFAVADGTKSYTIYLDYPNSKVFAWFQGGTQYAQTLKTDVDLSTYHDFVMVYNATTTDVNVYMDEEHICQWILGAAPASTSTFVEWGRASTSNGDMRVASVEFSTIPEPITMMLLVAGGFAILNRKRR